MAGGRTNLTLPVLRMTSARRSQLKYELKHVPWVPVVIIVIIVFAAVFAPIIAPNSPTKQSLRDKLHPPAWQEGGTAEHLLGTDILGRDILSRLIYGARVSSVIAATALLGGGAIGGVLGLISGYAGGKTDTLIMRAVDATLAFPTILFALLLAVTMGQGLQTVVLAVTPHLMGEICAGHQGRGSGTQGQRLCPAGPSPRLLWRPDYVLPHNAQCVQLFHGHVDAARWPGHSDRSITQFPRRWNSPAHTFLGTDGRRRQGEGRYSVVDFHNPWHRDYDGSDRVQLVRRLAQRSAGSQDAAALGST